MFKISLKKLLVVLLFVSAVGVFAQNQILTVGESNKMQNEALLLSQNDNATIIRFNLNELEL
ncbi:MAG: hypothetical protein LBU83_09700, partial [Bacteroidales bacterium]|nr:hypothetical protein [Bacteroidales bacterium]